MLLGRVPVIGRGEKAEKEGTMDGVELERGSKPGLVQQEGHPG